MECARCKRVLPFRVTENTTAHSVYFVNVLKNVRVIGTCDFCGSSFAYDRVPRCKRRWRQNQGLQSLVNETAPELGEVNETAPPTDDQLKALLDATAEQASVYDKNVGPGMLCGGVAGAVFGVGLGWLAAAMGVMSTIGPDATPTLCVLSGVAFFVAGLFIGGYCDGVRKYRLRTLAILEDAVVRNSIDLTHLARVARLLQHRALPIVERLETSYSSPRT